VWAHDSAIVTHGMARAGLRDAALMSSGCCRPPRCSTSACPGCTPAMRGARGGARSGDPTDGCPRPARTPRRVVRRLARRHRLV